MGQTCVCANRLYAQADVYEEFVQKLSTKVAAIKIREAVVRACTLSMSGAIAAAVLSHNSVLTAAALGLAGAVWT
jgi:hypothetical protein